MSSIPFIVIGTVIASRIAYTYGGEAMKSFLDRIVNAMQAMIGFFIQGAKPGVDYTKDKLQELEKQEKQLEKEAKVEILKAEKEEKLKEEQKEQEETKEKINEKQGTIEQFVPSNWNKYSEEQKIELAALLVSDMAENLGLKRIYGIDFKEMGEGEGRSFVDGPDNIKILTLDKNIYINNTNEGISVALFKDIVREMAYAKQDEIQEGLIEPNKEEKQLQKFISDAEEKTPKIINIPSFMFLGNWMKPNNNITVSSTITAPDNADFERKALCQLQPTERMPARTEARYYDKLKSLIIKDGNISNELQKALDDFDKISYFNAKNFLYELYSMDHRIDIEREIDKAFSKNNDSEQQGQDDKKLKINPQILYAIGLYQAKSYAEMNGYDFVDGREKIIESLCGTIPEMKDSQYQRDKGRLAYADITVEEVLSDDEWEKKYPKMDKNDFKKSKDKSSQNNSKDNSKHNESQEKDETKKKDSKKEEQKKKEPEEKESKKEKPDVKSPKDKKTKNDGHKNEPKENKENVETSKDDTQLIIDGLKSKIPTVDSNEETKTYSIDNNYQSEDPGATLPDEYIAAILNDMPDDSFNGESFDTYHEDVYNGLYEMQENEDDSWNYQEDDYEEQAVLEERLEESPDFLL